MATIDERARELGHKYARQYHHNTCFLEHDKSFVYSNDEITDACIEMATDQLNIDVDKAYKAFCISNCHVWKVSAQMYADCELRDKCAEYYRFKKALEE